MRTLGIFILTLLSWPLSGQPLIRTSSPVYPSNFVQANKVVQGHDGIIWIGSSTGILMFDGKRCHRLNAYDLEIISMLVDRDNLWAGTSTGYVALINLKDGVLLNYKRVSEFAINNIDKNGDVLAIATNGAGVILADKNDTLRINNSTGLKDGVAYQSIWNPTGNSITIATDRGTEIFEVKNLKTTPLHLTSHSGAKISTTLNYFRNNLLIGTFKNGIFEANDAKLRSLTDDVKLNGVLALECTSDEIFALDESGIWVIKEINSSKPVNILASNEIADFTIIDEGLLLALHSNGNITTIDLRLAAIGDSFDEPITALSEYNGVIYASSPGYVYQLNGTCGSLLNQCPLPNAALATRIIADKNEIFIGTFNEGLLVVNSSTCETMQYNSDEGLPDDNILDMSLYDDTLWMVSLGGFTSMDMNGQVKKHQTIDVLGSTYIYSVLASSNGILLGTDGNGLLSYKSGQYSRVAPDSLLQQSTVYNISVDGYGNTWFNTKGGQIYRIDKGDKITQSAKLITTAPGKLMLSGSSGHGAVVIGKDFLRILYDSVEIPMFKSAGFESLSGEYIHNLTLSDKGVLYFASGNRVFSLTEKYIRKYAPSAYIREVKVNLNTISLSKTEFNSDENHVAFYFGGVWYQNPEMLTFRYRINDGGWNITESNEAVFTNLGYGKYTFELQAGLDGSFIDGSAVYYSFVISKPVYLQIWFIVLCLVILTAIIAAILHLRLKNLNRRRMADQNLLQSQLSVLRTQVNPHFLFNSFNTLLNLIENDPEQASDYLQKMSDFYRKMLDDDKRQVVKLEEELENFQAYFFLQQKRFGEAIKAVIDVDEKHLNTYIPLLTLQILAENAIKHNTATRSKPLEIKISTDEGSLYVSNRIAIKNKPEAGTGTGLKNIASRYTALFKAKVLIENDGIQFIVKLPLIDQTDAGTHI